MHWKGLLQYSVCFGCSAFFPLEISLHECDYVALVLFLIDASGIWYVVLCYGYSDIFDVPCFLQPLSGCVPCCCSCFAWPVDLEVNFLAFLFPGLGPEFLGGLDRCIELLKKLVLATVVGQLLNLWSLDWYMLRDYDLVDAFEVKDNIVASNPQRKDVYVLLGVSTSGGWHSWDSQWWFVFVVNRKLLVVVALWWFLVFGSGKQSTVDIV